MKYWVLLIFFLALSVIADNQASIEYKNLNSLGLTANLGVHEEFYYGLDLSIAQSIYKRFSFYGTAGVEVGQLRFKEGYGEGANNACRDLSNGQFVSCDEAKETPIGFHLFLGPSLFIDKNGSFMCFGGCYSNFPEDEEKHLGLGGYGRYNLPIKEFNGGGWFLGLEGASNLNFRLEIGLYFNVSLDKT